MNPDNAAGAGPEPAVAATTAAGSGDLELEGQTAANHQLPLENIIRELQVLQKFCKILQVHVENSTTEDLLHLAICVLGKLNEDEEKRVIPEGRCVQLVESISADKCKGWEELVTIVCKLENTSDTLRAFVQGVCSAGQTMLANKLASVANLSPSAYTDPSTCLFIPEVATKFLQFLSPTDLPNARAACKTWNSVANDFVGDACEIVFTSTERVQEFLKTDSDFCRKMRKFKFQIGYVPDGQDMSQVMTPFFEKFGSQIKFLEFSTGASADLFSFVFGRNIQKYLINLETLELRSWVHKGDVLNMNFQHLTNLRHLTISAFQGSSGHGQLEFLKKSLEPPCRLQSLSLKEHFCMGGEVATVLANVMRADHLEALFIDSMTLCSPCRDTFEYWAEHMALTQLKKLAIDTGAQATPQVFYRFMNKCKDSLERLTLRNFDTKYMDAFPELPNLKYLELRFEKYTDFDLQFCARLPRLEKLRLFGVKSFRLSTSFESNSVKSVHLSGPQNYAYDLALSFLNFGCFSNLKKFVQTLTASDTRIEFSIRSSGLRNYLLMAPHIRHIKDESGITAAVSGSQDSKLIRDIKEVLLDSYLCFREAEASPTSNFRVMCLLSTCNRFQAHLLSYRDVRTANDTNWKYFGNNKRYKVPTVRELDLFDDISTFQFTLSPSDD